MCLLPQEARVEIEELSEAKAEEADLHRRRQQVQAGPKPVGALAGCPALEGAPAKAPNFA